LRFVTSLGAIARIRAKDSEGCMDIIILGTGAVSFAYAAYLSAAGHAVTLWSPTGKGARGLSENNGQLGATGILEGTFSVGIASADTFPGTAIGGAGLVIIALPAYAHSSVMRALANHVKSGQMILITPISSLSALYLNKLLVARGIEATVVASPTTVLTARRSSDTQVRINTLRERLDISVLPGKSAPRAIAIMEQLFGPRFDLQDGVLASSLANINPVAHVPLALTNLTRMENGEHWLQYENFTVATSRLISAVDAERLAIGAVFGFELGSIERHFQRSFGTTLAPLHDVARQIVALRQGGPAGPDTLESRYIVEDVPYGLVFLSAIGRLAGIATPVTDACITMASTCYQREFRRENEFLDLLEFETFDRREIAGAAKNGYPSP